MSLLFVLPCYGLTVTVVGAQGRLGRELVSQSLERDWDVIAAVRRPDDPIRPPSRTGWLTELGNVQGSLQDDPRVTVCDSDDLLPDTDATVFAMSGTPFQAEDTTTEVVSRICETTSPRCVCLVSAHGVGDSIVGADAGIRAMRGFYLKTTYASKLAQERIVSFLPGAETLILRPRVLSFERIPLNPISTRRQDLARVILDWVADQAADSTSSSSRRRRNRMRLGARIITEDGEDEEGINTSSTT